MEFASVISPMQVSELVETIEQGLAAYVPGRPDKFSALFSKAAFWKCVSAGKREGAILPKIALTEFQFPIAFDQNTVSRALRSGNTVCVSQLDKASEVLRELCLAAEEALGFPGAASVHCYYSPPGTGFSFFHIDSGVAITLQLEGEKKWQYAERAAVPWSIRVGGYREGTRLEWFGDSDWEPKPGTVPSPHEQGFEERTLRPGDMLIIPPGVWHSACATDSTSLSLNLKLTAEPSIESILEVVRQACLADERWRGPFPFASVEELQTGTISERARREVKERMLGVSQLIARMAENDGEVSRLWFRNFLGSQDNLRGSDDVDLADGDVVSIPPRVRPILSVAPDGTAALLGQGRIVHVHGKGVAGLLQEVLRRRTFAISDVRSWRAAKSLGAAAIRKIALKLVAAGFLVKAPRTTTASKSVARQPRAARVARRTSRKAKG